MKTVIMAGGRGTRISSVASDIPKPMIKIEGKPVLEHELECLRDQGFTDIILTVSHLGNIIMDYFGDGSGVSPATGKPFGVHIEYYFEKEPLGNAGALFKIKDRLDSDFLLLNADAVFDVDFNRFVAFHKQHGGLVTLFTHPNSHPYDSGLIIADKMELLSNGWPRKINGRNTIVIVSMQGFMLSIRAFWNILGLMRTRLALWERTENPSRLTWIGNSSSRWQKPERCSATTVLSMCRIWGHLNAIILYARITKLVAFPVRI